MDALLTTNNQGETALFLSENTKVLTDVVSDLIEIAGDKPLSEPTAMRLIFEVMTNQPDEDADNTLLTY